MKTTSLLFSLLIFIVNKNISQQYQTSIFERFDTIVIFDPETLVEEVRYVSSMNAIIEAGHCESLPKKFMAKTGRASIDEIKKLSAIELRCDGTVEMFWNVQSNKFDKVWEVQSFNLVVYKANQPPRTIVNWGSDFTPETKKALEEMKSGELITFEQIVLVHKQRGLFTAGFSLQIK
jgi:hypothetical protein